MNFGDILLLIVSICTFISYLPQIVKSITTEKTEDISIWSWILYVTSSVCYTLYAIFFQSNVLLIVQTTLESIMCVLILSLAIVYGGKHKKQKARG